MLLSMSVNDILLSIFTGAARGYNPNVSDQQISDNAPDILGDVNR